MLKEMISEAETAKLHVGYKQAVRALTSGNATKIYIAEDCEDRMKKEIAALADEHNALVTYVPTMKELGQMCRIDRGASCAAVLK